jgi:hypothetical protein
MKTNTKYYICGYEVDKRTYQELRRKKYEIRGEKVSLDFVGALANDDILPYVQTEAKKRIVLLKMYIDALPNSIPLNGEKRDKSSQSKEELKKLRDYVWPDEAGHKNILEEEKQNDEEDATFLSYRSLAERAGLCRELAKEHLGDIFNQNLPYKEKIVNAINLLLCHVEQPDIGDAAIGLLFATEILGITDVCHISMDLEDPDFKLRLYYTGEDEENA